MADAKLMELRAAIKAKKPTFLRQDAHKRKKLRETWRQPRGMHSKLRRKLGGRRIHPSMGWSSPRKVRGLNREGLRDVTIYTVSALAVLNPKIHSVVVGKVGTKNRLAILTACVEKKFAVSNIKDIGKYIKGVEEHFVQKKKAKKEIVAKKSVEADKKEKKEEAKTETPEAQHETKKGDKSDKIKVLEKRQ